jgi:hypothetical protein
VGREEEGGGVPLCQWLVNFVIHFFDTVGGWLGRGGGMGDSSIRRTHYSALYCPLPPLDHHLLGEISQESVLVCAVVSLHLSEVATSAVLMEEIKGLILDRGRGQA